eukprot:721249-Amphidinium_carterae.2
MEQASARFGAAAQSAPARKRELARNPGAAKQPQKHATTGATAKPTVSSEASQATSPGDVEDKACTA